MMKKGIKNIIIVAAVLAAVCVLIFAYYKLCMDPYRGTVDAAVSSLSLDEVISGETAREDLKYMMERLRKHHPAWIDGSGKDLAVEAQYERELTAIGNELSVLELYQSASRIMASLHDGHSYIRWQNNELERYLNDFSPLRNYGMPIAVDGIAAEELSSVYKEHASFEVEAYAREQFFNNAILCSSLLRLCGVDTSDGVVMSFERDGASDDVSFDLVPDWAVRGLDLDGGDSEWVYYEIDEEHSLAVFTLRSCRYNSEYLSTLDAFFTEVFDKNIENIALDLRGNGGGNSMVANEFIDYLDVKSYKSWDSAVRYGWYLLKNENIVISPDKNESVFDGELYVLTDIQTYSAAMDFAMLIADNGLGTIVGEPSGNLPDGYGDCLFFQMPNSKLLISVSFKKWSRIDSSKAGEAIMPDVLVSSGEALDKVYELIG